VEVGELSPDGYYSWDGTKWVSVEFGTKSPDGFFIWNGTQWIPIVEKINPPVVKKDEISTDMIQQINQPVIGTQQQFFVESTVQHQSFTQQPLMMVQKQNTNPMKILALITIGLVVAIAVIVVLSGVMYVWASSLADGTDVSIEGTWYNPADTMTLYANGTVDESTDTITQWSTENGNLTLTLLINEQEIDLISKYSVTSDSGGDSILFIALYIVENGTQIDEIDETSCIAYSDSVLGAETQHFEDRKAVYPSWCNPEHP